MTKADAFENACADLLGVIDLFREGHASAGGLPKDRREFTIALLEMASCFRAEAVRLRQTSENPTVVRLDDFRRGVC